MSYLAIDIGGSSIKYALMNDREILDRGDKIKTPREDLDAFLTFCLESMIATNRKLKVSQFPHLAGSTAQPVISTMAEPSVIFIM